MGNLSPPAANNLDLMPLVREFAALQTLPRGNSTTSWNSLHSAPWTCTDKGLRSVDVGLQDENTSASWR